MPHTTFLALWRTALDQAAAAQAASTTIAFRLPILVTAVTSDHAPSRREAEKMINEKVAATIEGAGAGFAAWHTMWIDAAFGRLTANTVMTGALAIANATVAPANRRAAANATRLARRATSPKRSRS